MGRNQRELLSQEMDCKDSNYSLGRLSMSFRIPQERVRVLIKGLICLSSTQVDNCGETRLVRAS